MNKVYQILFYFSLEKINKFYDLSVLKFLNSMTRLLLDKRQHNFEHQGTRRSMNLSLKTTAKMMCRSRSATNMRKQHVVSFSKR